MAGIFDFLNTQPAATQPTYAGQTDAGIYPYATPNVGAGPQLPSWLGTAQGAAGLARGGYGVATGAGSSFGPAWLGPAGFYAALIGTGKNLESSNANNGIGQTLLGGLAPSASQIAKDPMGMGLPTLFGAPFLTPFTGSKAARDTKPEWSGLFSLGQY